MNDSSTWLKLKEATGVANTIKAAGALDDKSIRHLTRELLDMLDEIWAEVERDFHA